jgi:carbon storage regulator
MLILTRRPGESIVINTDIIVTVVEVSSGQVRIGIRVPRHVQVHREEVFEQAPQQNVAAEEAANEARRRLSDRTLSDLQADPSNLEADTEDES